MTETPSKRISEATKAAENRACSRILVAQDGYIIILKAIIASHNGNKEIQKSLDSLQDNLGPTGLNVEHYFLSMLFLDLVAEVELFFSQVVRSVITEYPKKVGSVTFKLSEVIDANDVEGLVSRAVDEQMNKLMYKKPLDYLQSMCELISIEKGPLIEGWKLYIEAKARRDLGVHNQWKCNPTYLRKLEEGGISTDANIGDSLFPKYEDYLKPLNHGLLSLITIFGTKVKFKYAQNK